MPGVGTCLVSNTSNSTIEIGDYLCQDTQYKDYARKHEINCMNCKGIFAKASSTCTFSSNINQIENSDYVYTEIAIDVSN